MPEMADGSGTTALQAAEQEGDTELLALLAAFAQAPPPPAAEEALEEVRP